MFFSSKNSISWKYAILTSGPKPSVHWTHGTEKNSVQKRNICCGKQSIWKWVTLRASVGETNGNILRPLHLRRWLKCIHKFKSRGPIIIAFVLWNKPLKLFTIFSLVILCFGLYKDSHHGCYSRSLLLQFFIFMFLFAVWMTLTSEIHFQRQYFLFLQSVLKRAMKRVVEVLFGGLPKGLHLCVWDEISGSSADFYVQSIIVDLLRAFADSWTNNWQLNYPIQTKLKDALSESHHLCLSTQWRIQDFPWKEGANSQSAIILQFFCGKLHEMIEFEPWGACVPGAPWIRQWVHCGGLERSSPFIVLMIYYGDVTMWVHQCTMKSDTCWKNSCIWQLSGKLQKV